MPGSSPPMPLPAPVDAFYERLWNRKDRSGLAEILHPEVTFRGSLGVVRTGHEAFWRYVLEVTGPLADYRCQELACVSEGERVFARMRFAGRHVGVFRGFPPTGAHVAWEGAALFRIQDGRITDVWVLGDLAGLDAQLERQAREHAPDAAPDAAKRTS